MTPRAFGSCDTSTCASFVYVASVILPRTFGCPLRATNDEAILEQRRRLVSHREPAVEAEHQIRVAARELGRNDVLLPGADLEVHARRLVLQAGQQARQHHERDEVVRHDREVRAPPRAGSKTAGRSSPC